ncbi:type II toxin-antitoxin system RelB/DinJ family antitoxin [Helicobacter mesocricetorum]|uniref:type II toxin-antitoxin system RelB/DinJ family antitoxin n=1 Tax=Helicobacter mesocricetorum TaxID=87012 RepID=UPI000CF118F8|nr:type II toxin-antitoxin system RelB/DinJ family antitoxin [Helicobacter mesocricetorum]
MTSLIQVRVDKELKEEAERLFDDLGLDITTALRMFLKATVREQKIPFKLTRKEKDPFYSKENMARLKESIKELKEGKGITFTWEEFEDFSKAAAKIETQEEKEALIQRAQRGWSNV